MAHDKKVLVICPCCHELAWGNGRSSIACDHCGFAFIVHEEVEKPEAAVPFAESFADLGKALEEMLEQMREIGRKYGRSV